MKRLATLSIVTGSMTLSAAIFGFFYAWVCSTMWGLDAADPRVAIQAMQAMNGSVRNGVFAPAFFGTPIALILTGAVLWVQQARTSGALFWAAGLVYLAFGAGLTMVINVPMNQALATIVVPQDIARAREIWLDYSPEWQMWNQIRTVSSGVAFILGLMGVLSIPDRLKQS